MLIASLSSSPWPFGADVGDGLAELAQQRLDGGERVAVAADHDRERSRSRPAGMLPETGASSICAPSARDALGERRGWHAG